MMSKTISGTKLTAYVRMLGGFDLSVGEHTVSDSVGRTHQLWNLLEYLIANRKKTVSQDELISALWPDEDSENPANALKNLIYRIRTALAAAGIEGAKDLIVYRNGAYSWNPEYPCVVDAEQFEKLISKLDNSSVTIEKRVELGMEALNLYRGDFLPLSSYEQWVVPLAAYYRSAYFQCVQRICELLLTLERYDDICAVCLRASEIDQFEEAIHRYYITALIRKNKTGAALNYYNYVTDLFYREMGVKPSEELRRLYREITGTLGSIETDLSVIKDDLTEKEDVAGAFYCDYEVFKNMYRIEARAAARTGQMVFIGLLTVTAPDGSIPERTRLNRAMDELIVIVRQSLRKGDVVARFSATQYVLMLPTLTFENGRMVLNRICKRYRREGKTRDIRIQYSLQPLEPII